MVRNLNPIFFNILLYLINLPVYKQSPKATSHPPLTPTPCKHPLHHEYFLQLHTGKSLPMIPSSSLQLGFQYPRQPTSQCADTLYPTGILILYSGHQAVIMIAPPLHKDMILIHLDLQTQHHMLVSLHPPTPLK